MIRALLASAHTLSEPVRSAQLPVPSILVATLTVGIEGRSIGFQEWYSITVRVTTFLSMTINIIKLIIKISSKIATVYIPRDNLFSFKTLQKSNHSR